jgi:glutamyl-tRNA reductase
VQKQIVIVGLNHRSAPIDVRESVAFENSYVADALARLHGYPSILEGVILSTCNRVEVIAAAADEKSALSEITSFLAAQKAQRHAGAL